MVQPAFSAGGADWVAIWRDMYQREREQAERIAMPTQPDCWAVQAPRFAAAAERSQQPDAFMRFLLPRLCPTDTVLDIGAGSGRYESVLAGAVSEVLALEPSPAMRTHLEQRIANEHLSHVQVIPAGWPMADIPTCDVAIAAHVLYAVGEIEPFLRRMYAVARRSGYVLLAFRHPSSFISPFWQLFHGEPRLPLPGALECLNVMYQLGIPAQLTLVSGLHRFNYAGRDEALADLSWRLRLPADTDTEQALDKAIDTFLEQGEDGSLSPREQPTHAAVLWWEHESSAE